MSPSLTIVFAAVRGVLRPSATDGGLNPDHIALASQGYWIQSQILNIPDRFGMFSPGPAPLLAHQGAFFACLIVCLTLIDIWTMVLFFMFTTCGNVPGSKLARRMAMVRIILLPAIWIVACQDPHRAPDYNWENWNSPQE